MVCTSSIHPHTTTKFTSTYGYQGFPKFIKSCSHFSKILSTLLTIKAGCIESNGKNWLLNPESSSQSEGYSSKWLIWLVVREPLVMKLLIGGDLLVYNTKN